MSNSVGSAAPQEIDLSSLLDSAGDRFMALNSAGDLSRAPVDELYERLMSDLPKCGSQTASSPSSTSTSTMGAKTLIKLPTNLASLVSDAPGANGGSFRLTAKKLLLTYPGHLDKQDLYIHIVGKFNGNCEMKICHETGSTGHAHTHAVLSLNAKPDIKNARFFDHDDVHPNIALPKTVQHWHNMVKYIEKEDDDCYGELTLKNTSSERFSNAADYVRSCTSVKQIYSCPDTETAMTIASRLPYFTQLWNHCGKKMPTKAPHSTGFAREMLDTSHNWLIWGAAGTGKTNFALAHFICPVLISHIDDLKKITDETDGIVFDDMAFNKYPHGSIIHLLDKEVDRSIHSRYFNAVIPANIPKMFTSNRDDIFLTENCNEEQENAVKRRYKSLHVTGKLF